MPKWKAAVIGLGRIGQTLDEGMKPSSYCLTHASAFSQHPDFELVAGVDPNPNLREKFRSRFNQPAFEKVEELDKLKSIDILVIAGPTNENFQVLKVALTFKPKFILLEKPMGKNLDEAREILQLVKKTEIPVGINFMRRAEPGALRVKELIRLGGLGQVEKVILTYSKGLANNGSHFIDLMRLWLGESSDHQVIGSLDQNFEGDPEPDFSIRFGKVPVYFLSAREKYYSVRDVEILGSKGALHYLRGGQKILHYQPIESQVFKGYKFLGLEPIEITSELDRSQLHVADRIAKFLKTEEPTGLEAETALRTMEDVERIRKLCQVH